MIQTAINTKTIQTVFDKCLNANAIYDIDNLREYAFEGAQNIDIILNEDGDDDQPSMSIVASFQITDNDPTEILYIDIQIVSAHLDSETEVKLTRLETLELEQSIRELLTKELS